MVLRNSALNRFILGNKVVERNSDNLFYSQKNKVNLNAWIVPNSDNQNTGDYISKIIVESMCSKLGIDINKKVAKTEHLYAIGSILMGYQDMVVWGSGFGYDKTVSSTFKLYKLLHKIRNQKIDVRAVRGPETRRILINMGYSCPDVYGDPAVLLPIFLSEKHKKEV